MDDELLSQDSELPAQNERPRDPDEQFFREAGETLRTGIGEIGATLRQGNRQEHERDMKEIDERIEEFLKKERDNIEEEATKQIEIAKNMDLSGEQKLEVIDRILESKEISKRISQKNEPNLRSKEYFSDAKVVEVPKNE